MHAITLTQRTLKIFLAGIEKHNAINTQTDGHMRAVLASVIRQYLPERYSHNDWGESKFYHLACPPATVLPGENPLLRGKRLCKNIFGGKGGMLLHGVSKTVDLV